MQDYQTSLTQADREEWGNMRDRVRKREETRETWQAGDPWIRMMGGRERGMTHKEGNMGVEEGNKAQGLGQKDPGPWHMDSRNQEVIDCKGFFLNPSIKSNMHLKLCCFFPVNYRYLCCFQKQNLKKIKSLLRDFRLWNKLLWHVFISNYLSAVWCCSSKCSIWIYMLGGVGEK